MSKEPREFNWGPPESPFLEIVKEKAIYFLFIFLFILGGWLLWDATWRERNESFAAISSTPNSSSKIEVSVASTSIASGLLNSSESSKPLKHLFMVQLGAYGDEQSALIAYEKALSLGFKVSIAPPNEQFELYRLVSGPFETEAEAEVIARKLNELDFSCFVIESF